MNEERNINKSKVEASMRTDLKENWSFVTKKINTSISILLQTNEEISSQTATPTKKKTTLSNRISFVFFP